RERHSNRYSRRDDTRHAGDGDGADRRLHRARAEEPRRRSRPRDDSCRGRDVVPEVPPVPRIKGAHGGAAPAAATLSDQVAHVFSAEGPLVRVLPGFEPRAGQVEMALAAARAFEDGGVLLVEAGTGTGKTLAYLVPAILSRQRVLISTGTKNLQEQ